MEPGDDSRDAVRRLEAIVAKLVERVEHLEEELRARQKEPGVELFPRGAEKAPSALLTGDSGELDAQSLHPVSPGVASSPEEIPSGTSSPPPIPPAYRFDNVRRLAETSASRPDEGHATVTEGPSPVPELPTGKPASPAAAPAARISRGDLETKIATYWFPRIGLGLIALMFVYVAQLYSRGPWPKIAFGYSAAVALAVAGIWQRRRQPVWAEPVIAGGLALSYFMTYSMGFVRPMKVIDSLFLEVALLTVNVLLVLGVAQWLRSEVVAGVALVLGYFTTGISGTERYALISVGVLSLAAVTFMAVNRWVASTAVSVVATYAAHLYAYAFLDRPKAESPADVFWHHAVHLIAYFSVFAIGALLAQRRVVADALPPEEAEDKTRHLPHYATARLLAIVVQVNIGLFVSGMIFLLRQTGVYWETAWMFFFPLAAVAYVLSRLHAPLPAARAACQLAAAVGLTFGLIATASPAWLPVLLAVQAVGLLRLGTRERNPIWIAISLVVLIYAGLEAMFPAQVGLLGLGAAVRAPMEWWAVMATTALYLAYSWILERAITREVLPRFAGLGSAVGVLAGVMYTWGMGRSVAREEDAITALLWAGPAVAAAAIALRAPVWLSFTNTASVLSLLVIGVGYFANASLSLASLTVYTATALGAGIALEKMGSGSSKTDGNCARLLYLGVHTALAVLMGELAKAEWFVPAETAVALGTVVLAFVATSRRLFWSALLPSGIAVLAFIPQLSRLGGRPIEPVALLAGSILMVMLAVLFGTRSVGERLAEDFTTRRQSVSECVLMVAAGSMAILWGHWVLGAGFFLVGAIFGLAASAAGVLAGRPLLTGTGFFFLSSSVLFLLTRVARPGILPGDSSAAWSGIATVALMIVAERVLFYRKRLYRASHSSSHPDETISEATADLLGKWLAGLGMVMLLLAIYCHPAVRSFYLSAAIVGAGFFWIVLGFLFQSGMYRKVGFGVVCFAVIKALGYDTRKLSRELQIVSLGVLGGVLLLAGWIYSRYRARLSGSDELHNPSSP